MARWVVGLVVVAACTEPTPRRPVAAPPVAPKPAVVTAPPSDAAVLAVPPDAPPEPAAYLHHPGTEPVRRTVTRGKAKPFVAKKGVVTKLAVKHLDVVRELPVFGTRAAMSHSGTKSDDITLVDVKTKQVKELGDDVTDGSSASGTLVLDTDAGHTLYFVADDRTVAPAIKLPSGTVAEYRIAVVDDADVVWLFARSTTGRAFHGRWTDPRKPEISLRDELPAFPTAIHSDAGLVEVETQQCPHGFVVYPSVTGCAKTSLTYLGEGRWIDGAAIIDATGAQRGRLHPHCPPAQVSVHSSGARAKRVLSQCTIEGDQQPFELWSPDARWVWYDTMDEYRSVPFEIVPQQSPVEPNTLAITRVLDVESATLLTAPALVPLAFAGRHVVAYREDKPDQLVDVDLARGVIEPIGNFRCTMFRGAVDVVDSRVLVMCAGTDAGGRFGSAPGSWSAILDLSTRTSWKVAGIVGDRLVPGGAIGYRRWFDEEDFREMKAPPELRGGKAPQPSGKSFSDVVFVAAP